MAIWIIRHGETSGNANRVVQVPETPLSERGVAQAKRLGERLTSGAIRHILASDYARAAMTAESVRDAIGVEIEPEPLLRERNFGLLRGRPYAELDVDIFDPNYEPPAGESWEIFDRRVDAAWERIQTVAATVSGDLAVVTHGLVLYSLTLRRLALDRADTPGFDNTSITIVDPAPPWRIHLLNCTAHLDGPDASDPDGLAS